MFVMRCRQSRYHRRSLVRKDHLSSVSERMRSPFRHLQLTRLLNTYLVQVWQYALHDSGYTVCGGILHALGVYTRTSRLLGICSEYVEYRKLRNVMYRYF